MRSSRVSLFTGMYLFIFSCFQVTSQFPVFAESTYTRSDLSEFKDSPFGLHGLWGLGDYQEARKLGAGYVRRIVRWFRYEPREGVYRLVGSDKAIRNAQDNDINHIITFRAMSTWGGTGWGGTLKGDRDGKLTKSGYPRRMDAWLKFVETLVERYDGDGINDMPGLVKPIEFYQVENEWYWQWVGEPEEYVAFLKETSAAIRKASSNAKVIAGAIEGFPIAVAEGFGDKNYITWGWTDESKREVYASEYVKTGLYRKRKKQVELLLKNGSPYFDIVDFHSYSQDPYRIKTDLKWLHKKMEEYGYQKEIWSLENAGPFFNFSPERFAEDVVKRHIIGFSNGLDRLFWSSFKPAIGWSENFIRLALIDRHGNKSPAYYTYKLMTDKLKGLKSVKRMPTPTGISGFKARKKSGEIYVLWSDSVSQKYLFPISVKKIMLTNIVTRKGQPPPETKRIAVKDGRIMLEVSSPVFIEPIR